MENTLGENDVYTYHYRRCLEGIHVQKYNIYMELTYNEDQCPFQTM